MSIGKPPHYDSFVFQRRAVSLACTPIQLMNATCAIAAAAPLKNKRNGVGCLATIDMALLTELGRQHAALTEPSVGFHVVEQKLTSTNHAPITLSFDGERRESFSCRKLGVTGSSNT